MPRYAIPRFLRWHASPRIIVACEGFETLGSCVSGARNLCPDPALLVLVLDPKGSPVSVSSQMELARSHPHVDAVVLGRPDLEELAESWQADYLMVPDSSGRIAARRLNRD